MELQPCPPEVLAALLRRPEDLDSYQKFLVLILGTFRIRAACLLSQWEQCQAEEGACALDVGLRGGGSPCGRLPCRVDRVLCAGPCTVWGASAWMVDWEKFPLVSMP